jgi:hypothetical protein
MVEKTDCMDVQFNSQGGAMYAEETFPVHELAERSEEHVT